MAKIKDIQAREVLDSRGFPTVEVNLLLPSTSSASSSSANEDFVTGHAIVPSGASTGEGEALELRDGDPKRYLGKGVLKAVEHIRNEIRPALRNQEIKTQAELDQFLRQLDGTPNKSKLGANAILGVSMAFTRAQALSRRIPTYQLIAEEFKSTGTVLPVPLMNIINGGKHADNGLAIQEFMIVPAGFSRFSEALRAGAETFHHLKKILSKKGKSTAVGDEGGFAPSLEGLHPHKQALSLIMEAIEAAGYRAGKDIFLALDSAASEFSVEKISYQFEGKRLSSKEMISIYSEWVNEYPIISIEDGLAEHDWSGWKTLTDILGKRCQLVGDDLFVTNPVFLKEGIEKKVANSVLIKLNQIGTVSETFETMAIAKQTGYASIISHRSGETEDTFIADLAVGTDSGQIKTGSASRTDRIAKYNQLLRLEEQLGEHGTFAGSKIFEKFFRKV